MAKCTMKAEDVDNGVLGSRNYVCFILFTHKDRWPVGWEFSTSFDPASRLGAEYPDGADYPYKADFT